MCWCAVKKLLTHSLTLPRRQTRWNLQGCPKLTKRSQPLVGRSSPYYVEEILLLNKFFRIVNACLICEDIARQSCMHVCLTTTNFVAFGQQLWHKIILVLCSSTFCTAKLVKKSKHYFKHTLRFEKLCRPKDDSGYNTQIKIENQGDITCEHIYYM